MRAPSEGAMGKGAAARRSGLSVVQTVFLVVALAGLLTPFVATFGHRSTATQASDETTFPKLVTSKGVNNHVLGQAGSWFEGHFAGRNAMISAQARIQGALFGVSVTDQVVLGKDGWLYYDGDLADYVGTAPLSERALSNIAHNLALMQSYAESQGAAFTFTIAPNKASVWPRDMPSRYPRSPDETNAERLIPYLRSAGVSYTDLFAPMTAEQNGGAAAMYLRTDSHWNNRGALIGGNLLSQAVGVKSLPAPVAWTARRDFLGDLEAMLYPVGPDLEQQWYYPGVNDGPGTSGSAWRYTGQASAVDDDLVSTASENASATGSLLVFRDSFGNALVPYFATEAAQATFTKLVPYNAMQIGDVRATAVIVEIAERHLYQLAYQPPYLPAPRVERSAAGAVARPLGCADCTVEQTVNGPLISISGVIDPRLIATGTRVLVGLQSPSGEDLYEAFGVTAENGGDNGYQAFFLSDSVASDVATVNIYVMNGGQLVRVAQEAFK
ncbi:MAG: hypothetical protein FWD74_00040 [Actinomycetia bacterium]|nr:hypothetical protein [Actinomycetes bacterium]